MEKKSIYAPRNEIQNPNYCWIHLKDLRFFLYLGANPYEKKIGQNITIDLSLNIKYEMTHDKLENTVNYALVVDYLKNRIEQLKEVSLLEFLCEQILNELGTHFKDIKIAKIKIKKGYVPLENFTGSVQIEAEKIFY